MVRPAALTLALLGGLLRASPPAWSEDTPQELRIEAQRHGHESGTAVVAISPDGAVRATWDERGGTGPADVVEFRIPREEMDRARDAVVAARFFEEWEPGLPVADGSTWTVWVRLGSRELRRARIRYPPQFEPLRDYLDRFADQAMVTARLRQGDYLLAGAIPFGHGPRVAHLSALLDELVSCAARQPTPGRCAGAADLMLSVAGPEDWLRPTRDLLSRLEGDRRAAVLTAWTVTLRQPEKVDRRAAFAPILRAEAAALAPHWASLSRTERLALEHMLGSLLEDGDPRGFEIAERMARTTGEVRKPFVPPGLVEVGEAVVPLTVRLMEAEEAQARANAVETARRLLGRIRSYGKRSEPHLVAASAALERRFADDVVPAIARRLRDAAEPYAVRRTCAAVLDRWDGRCTAAHERAIASRTEARKREAAERIATRGPASSGHLGIAGRLLGPFDIPLPGFTVHALSGDGRSAASAVTGDDGSYLVAGLAEGTYDLVEGASGNESYPAMAPPAAMGVDAGSDGIVLRLPESMIRGRLLDASGTPVAFRSIQARAWGGPHEYPTFSSARATTDAQGRFWFVRLPPGLYDIAATSRGYESIVGGVGVSPGPEERTLEARPGAPIVGRLLDETGAPISSAAVDLIEPGPLWFTYRRARTSADGSFRFDPADPLRDYRIHAVVVGDDGRSRGALAEGVRGGSDGLVLRLGDTPRLRFRVDYAGRGGCEPDVRVVRVAGGPVLWHRLTGDPVDWPAAPPGTWRVLVRARELDAEGIPRCDWVHAGTARTGAPEPTLVVPP
ncbi:MAG TPA: carboxypeptidase-like regulatory domain-containing protein [Planctomycetota bacterium]|nr:carboxypeptidase-like regulatory domain-containing protein [Planctomycetota bacterium]